MDLSTPLKLMRQPDLPQVEELLAGARSGKMSLDTLVAGAASLQGAGMNEASALLYRTWLDATRSPLRHIALFNLGTQLSSLKKDGEAEAVYREALQLVPGFVQASLNLGHQLERQGKTEEALAEWAKIHKNEGLRAADQLELRLHALNNAARTLETLKRYDEAHALMRKSLELKPGQTDVMQHYVHIRQKQCEWPVYQPVGEVTHNQLLVATSLLSMLSATDDPALQLMSSMRFVYERVKKYPEALYTKLASPRSGKVRIGYLSGDLCMHAVGLLTAEMFELHDKKRFEVFGFEWSREDGSELRSRILKSLDHHVRIADMDDETAARTITACGIDVLVDLQGLTNGARPNILSQRPAPIQVGYLGLPATSALPGVDWIIADRFVMPPEYLPYCTEKPIHLKHTYQVSDRKRPVGATPTRKDLGLPEDKFVFCSFNNNHKFREDMFAAWMRILAQVEDSVLWLLADNEWARANMIKVAAAHGVAAERLIFAPRAMPADYLARFQAADLVLDTFPYNAGTTANDCLWMGTPILTYSGRSYISRMAGSLLTAVGLPDLITFSLEEYEQRAVQIGRNPARAWSYKRFLREHGRGSPLFDIPATVRDIEDNFERMALAQRAKEQAAKS
ncbi:MAG: acetylglucosamine transferase [Paucibacter sp.]|nr:acetylglucosamine transferase [Roseateles sp.]